MPWSTKSELRAVLDTCILAPMPLCDTLLRCAEEPALYEPIWSEETLLEIHRTMLKFGYSATKADHRVASMRSAFPNATIQLRPEAIQTAPELPDPKDRHILAAAIEGEADLIVTSNLRHFPYHILEKLDIIALSPDDFLSAFFHFRPEQVLEVLDGQARAMREERAALLRRLRRIVPNFVQLAETTSA
jgi:predicted nucleic acid-binding protein